VETLGLFYYMNITLNGEEIDLVKELDFHFDLNEQQLEAINTIVEFVGSTKKSCTLQGSAGTGKTTIVKILLYYISRYTNKGYLLCAPTHKARMVLESLTDEGAETLHSVLTLKPNLDLQKFDAREIDFMEDKSPQKFKYAVSIPYDGLLIIDEASMINNDLYALTLKKAAMKNCKILFIGDIAQIQPVKQGEVSKVFDAGTNNIKISLTRVERQKGDNPLLDTLNILREQPLYIFEDSINDGVGLTTYIDNKEFFREIKKNMTPETIVADPYRNRVLCYTNAKTQSYNGWIRTLLGYKQKGEINPGELLMAFDSIGDKGMQLITNSCDYIVTTVEDILIEVPEFGNVRGYGVGMVDVSVNDKKLVTKYIKLLRNDLYNETYENLAEAIERMRTRAVVAKEQGKYYYGMFWKKYYAMMEAANCMRNILYENRVIKKKTMDYGYAHTVHKSQGATYENIFVDMSDVMKCQDVNELRQLQYVALSRARKMANILI
jgi:exodeoxyribonuclease-5